MNVYRNFCQIIVFYITQIRFLEKFLFLMKELIFIQNIAPNDKFVGNGIKWVNKFVGNGIYLYLCRWKQMIYGRKSFYKEDLLANSSMEAWEWRQAIKYLVKDGRYNYIETGSLISIKKHTENITIILGKEMKSIIMR